MVRRVYVEKRDGFNMEARRLKNELADFLGPRYPELRELTRVRILKRYDVSALDKEQFKRVTEAVFSEPQCDLVFYGSEIPAKKTERFFGIEYLPGQYDQRADSAEQCAELVSGVKPRIKTARFYIFENSANPVSAGALEAAKKYLINPVDSREASAETPDSLEDAETSPEDVPCLTGFIRGASAGKTGSGGAFPQALEETIKRYGLSMSAEDLLFCRNWFAKEGRDPTLAELKILDTYWSDHCRHTTFNTILEEIKISGESDDGAARSGADSLPENEALNKALELYEETRREVYGAGAEKRPRSLMDMATLGTKALKKRGLANDLDESPEINACTIKVNAEFSHKDGGNSSEPWLLLFKNETHNHPTEIEPFGGAATCLGGAIRDPLSGRAFVHQAMRVTGSGDPRAAFSDTLPGKLPQVKIAREAAAGYSSYGNQIGLATGQVAEFYHPGFLAKRMELGAVIGAVPEAWVRREEPAPGDEVILVGGRTGRDGIGGATGSSKIHTGESVESAGAEVQKGNAVEERKLQRLFRKAEVCRLVKRCNDFGAGGVSVAVGELAAGLDIDLDKVPKKYSGLDGTELAISESQERMAVVVSASDTEAFIRAAAAENLEAVVIAKITAGIESEDTARLRMSWRGKTIVDISREFLNSNGAPRTAKAVLGGGDKQRACQTSPLSAGKTLDTQAADISGGAEKRPLNDDLPNLSADALARLPARVILDKLERELAGLRSGSRRGLKEQFDGTVGAASVLFPWGGSEQGTPECGMAALLPAINKQSDKESRTASLMSFGYNPFLLSRDPYMGAKGSVREALAKFACLGGDPFRARLSLQEFFQKPVNPETWGRPAAALLGALEAQLRLGVPAIGGKDSMSGNYRDDARGINLAVPPTLVAFAAGTAEAKRVRSGALSGKAGHAIILLSQSPIACGQPPHDEWELFRINMKTLEALTASGAVKAAYPVEVGGVAATLAKMAFGSMSGVEAYAESFSRVDSLTYQGSILVEIDEAALPADFDFARILAGRTLDEPVFRAVNSATLKEQQEEENPESLAAEIPLDVLRRAYEYPLSRVYPQTSGGATVAEPAEESANAALLKVSACAGAGAATDTAATSTGAAGAESAAGSGTASRKAVTRNRAGQSPQGAPLAVLPVFPGTNCEWDMERAFREAGARTRLVIFKNRSRRDIASSLKELALAFGEAQIIALSGGFSSGDEPDGSGKFIANVLRAPAIAEAVTEFLDTRGGLMLGICNGFQALIKTGLVPYGRIIPPAESMPTLTFNTIGRHVSRMARTRVMPNISPWLSLEKPGSVHIIPVSHGEGRVAVRDEEAAALFAAGQVPLCYTDSGGKATMAEPDNPNGSDFAIEALTSPDGRVLGKMAHSERYGEFVHVNIPGNKRQRIFEAGVGYFKG